MATGVHQSAKMRDAQAYFQQVVKQELQVLLARGMERQAAVKRLLHRIVASTDDPEEMDVQRVMRQFEMNHEDAVRALIVKQEIGRLKRQGLDAFAAIEELTRKMQVADGWEGDGGRITIGTSMEIETTPMDAALEDESPRARSPSWGSDKSAAETTGVDDDGDMAMGMESPEASTSPRGASLMLCQGINNVSISTLTNMTARASPPASFALFSSSSRKRRAQRPASPSPSPERDLAARFRPLVASDASCASHPEREQDAEIDPQEDDDENPIPNRWKKQRLWDHVSDSFASAVTLKNTVVAPASPTAVSSRDEEPTPTTRPGRGKRPYSSTTSAFDLMTLGDPLFHMSKRHKN